MISFVNPIFLSGLALAALPALLHLMKRDPGRRVPFPATMLLVSSGDVVLRRWTLDELVLLALRVLVIAGLFLALARPRVAVTGLGVPGEGGQAVLASVAIVVDDTPSMASRASGGSTRIEEARRAAGRALDRLAPGSRVRIQAASGLLLDAGVDLEEARLVAEGLAVSDVARPVRDAVAESVEWLRGEPEPRELYVISDFQRSSWSGGSASGAGVSTPLSGPRGTAVYAVDVGARAAGEGSRGDWAVTGAHLVQPRAHHRLPFGIRVEVAASSAGTRDLVLELGGHPVGRAPRRLPSERLVLRGGERTEVTFRVASQETGPLVGIARLVEPEGAGGPGEAGRPGGPGRADDWPANDWRAFTVQVLPPVRVLCVKAPSGEARLAGELVSRALAPFPGGERELARVHEAPPPVPRQAELDGYDCVVVASPSSLEAGDWLRLRTFVEDGGGLFVFSDLGTREKEGDLASAAVGLLPASSARMRVPPFGVRLVGLDYEHPLLRSFEGGANGELGAVRFRRFLALDVAEDARTRILAWFAEGGERGGRSPALVEAMRGRGRVLFLASGPTASWGGLFREPVFVPFLHEAAAFLARSGPGRLDVLAGERPTVELHPSERGCSARLEERSSSPPAVRELAVDAERLELPLGRLERRGVYHVVTSSRGDARAGRQRAVAVELDPSEFAPERADVARALGRRARLAGSADELSAAYARTRGGAELTAYFAWATLLVFVAEILVSARLTRRRSGSQGQASNVRGAI